MDGLAVDAPFPCDDEIRVGYFIGQLQGFDHYLDAGLELGPEQADQGGAHATGGARPRQFLHLLAEGQLDAVGVVGQIGVQLGHHLGGRPLLRAEHGGGAFRAAQRVVHVTGHLDDQLAQAGIQPAQIDARQLTQGPTAQGNRAAIGLEQLAAERLDHAGTAVVGGTAADAEDEVSDPHLQRGQDQLASAEAGGEQRIALLRCHQMDTGGRRHLDDGTLAITQQADETLHLVAKGRGHLDRQYVTTGGIHQGLHRALAAIGHGQFDIGGIRQHLFETSLDGICHRHGAQTLLE
ncbi:hypothetical protein D3C72_1267660 [compost metagenome]